MLPGPSPAVSAEPPLASVACSPLLPVSRTWLPCSAPDLAEFSCPVTRFLLQASHQPSASLSPEGAIFLEFFFSFFIIIWCGPHQFSVALARAPAGPLATSTASCLPTFSCNLPFRSDCFPPKSFLRVDESQEGRAVCL